MPIEMAPRNSESKRRCCIYKERAVIKYKTMPILGFCPSEETDELKSLSDYATEALKRQNPPTNKILTVVDEACTSCIKANYIVSNFCRGCVARWCQMNCPKDVISINNNGQAQIDSHKCISCGICKQACPYHAIIYIPVPCEEACPVGAIKKNEFGVERIDNDKCIYCGKCINACPFGSVFEISHSIDILSNLTKQTEMTALIAPSLYGQFNCNPGQIISALKKIGFTHIVEVAEGASLTAKYEAEELRKRFESGCSLMTTSCCPSYVETVNKHIFSMKKMVSHTPSPMHFAGELARERFPQSKNVFIGPCVAKRKEGIDSEFIDFVMTFEELDAIFIGFEIDLTKKAIDNYKQESPVESVNFAVTGGVTNAVKKAGKDLFIKEIIINGIDKKSIGLLKTYSRGNAPGNFVEVMACNGGCINGPCTVSDGKTNKKNFDLSLETLFKKEVQLSETIKITNP